ncbi:MAG: L28 family ribosomal protein [Candidatus Portnoybacteria bacterium]|nr:L28 family ribosomal protein [Candidatus Portnoybacteria bacterium]MDD4982598.1 L28 family ribosomal protein [Candidatus Portnoybacteria bacterium]
MPRTCSICGKGSQMSTRLVKLRGKFNPTTKIRKYPNLQWVKLATGKRVKACAQCIRTLHKK